MSDHHAYLRLLMAFAGPLADRFDVIHNHSLHHLPVAMAPLLPIPMLTTPAYAADPVARVRHPGHAHEHPPRRPRSRRSAPTSPGSGGCCGRNAAPSVVANGVDVSAWPAGPGGDGLTWSGRIVPEKAPHLAIQAARLAGMRLVIAGPMSDLPYFEQAIRPHLGQNVEYAGHLLVPELSHLVGSSAAVLVTPLWDEPYGLVVAEALASGTPVVAFERGGIPEVIADSSVGRLVRPGDVRAMADAASAVAGLDRVAVREYAERYLSVDRMVTAYERAYRRLAPGPIAEADRTA